MTIFVTSSIVNITWYDEDGNEVNTTEDTVELLKVFRKLTDAIEFVNGYDYYSDEDHKNILKEAEIQKAPTAVVWVDEDPKTFGMCSTVEFRSKTYLLRYELYIEERELV